MIDFEELKARARQNEIMGVKVMGFEAMVMHIKALWVDLHQLVSDLPEEKKAKILTIVEELEAMTSQAEEEART